MPMQIEEQFLFKQKLVRKEFQPDESGEMADESKFGITEWGSDWDDCISNNRNGSNTTPMTNNVSPTVPDSRKD